MSSAGCQARRPAGQGSCKVVGAAAQEGRSTLRPNAVHKIRTAAEIGRIWRTCGRQTTLLRSTT